MFVCCLDAETFQLDTCYLPAFLRACLPTWVCPQTFLFIEKVFTSLCFYILFWPLSTLSPSPTQGHYQPTSAQQPALPAFTPRFSCNLQTVFLLYSSLIIFTNKLVKLILLSHCFLGFSQTNPYSFIIFVHVKLHRVIQWFTWCHPDPLVSSCQIRLRTRKYLDLVYTYQCFLRNKQQVHLFQRFPRRDRVVKLWQIAVKMDKHFPGLPMACSFSFFPGRDWEQWAFVASMRLSVISNWVWNRR